MSNFIPIFVDVIGSLPFLLVSCCSHRHQTDHDCEKYEAPKERMTKTKEHVQRIVGKSKL